MDPISNIPTSRKLPLLLTKLVIVISASHQASESSKPLTALTASGVSSWN
jgi:hypothetical protein